MQQLQEGNFNVSRGTRLYSAASSNGFRVTLQRLIVLDAVCDVGGHASLSAILARVEELDPTIDQSTIYRALDVLVEAELVVTSEIDGTKIYEIAAPIPHHHLVCRRCGKVQRLNHDTVLPMLNAIRKEYGFQVTTDHIILSGLCSNCQNE